MPSSPLHSLLVAFLRSRSESAADLLRALDAEVPEFDEIRHDSNDLTDLKPAEYRADMVLFLIRQTQKVLGVIVEVQLGRDQEKQYTWPAYIANLRSLHRCPVCLLVFTTQEAVARWARKPIELGPGTRCQPWVFGPSNTPTITEPQQAQANRACSVISG